MLRAQEYYIQRNESPWPRRSRDSRTKVEVNAVKPTDKCNSCGGLGHWARDCLFVGDLRSYDSKPSPEGKSRGVSKAPAASVPAGSCQYCSRDHNSSDCFQAKSLMRQAGYVTSGRGGAASNARKKTLTLRRGQGRALRVLEVLKLRVLDLEAEEELRGPPTVARFTRWAWNLKVWRQFPLITPVASTVIQMERGVRVARPRVFSSPGGHH